MKDNTTPYNKRGFYSKNNTQLFKKDHFAPKESDSEVSLPPNSPNIPSGEDGLPSIH